MGTCFVSPKGSPRNVTVYTHTHTDTDTHTHTHTQVRHQHIPQQSTTQRRLALAQLLSALWLPLRFVYLCTLTFAVKLRLTWSTMARCRRSNLEFISTRKFPLNSNSYWQLEEFDPWIKVNGVCSLFASLYDLFLTFILKSVKLCGRAEPSSDISLSGEPISSVDRAGIPYTENLSSLQRLRVQVWSWGPLLRATQHFWP